VCYLHMPLLYYFFLALMICPFFLSNVIGIGVLLQNSTYGIWTGSYIKKKVGFVELLQMDRVGVDLGVYIGSMIM